MERIRMYFIISLMTKSVWRLLHNSVGKQLGIISKQSNGRNMLLVSDATSINPNSDGLITNVLHEFHSFLTPSFYFVPQSLVDNVESLLDLTCLPMKAVKESAWIWTSLFRILMAITNVLKFKLIKYCNNTSHDWGKRCYTRRKRFSFRSYFFEMIWHFVL